MTALPCAHCGLPEEGHGRRYAAIPGWHDWKRDVPAVLERYTTVGYVLPGVSIVRNDSGAPVPVTRLA